VLEHKESKCLAAAASESEEIIQKYSAHLAEWVSGGVGGLGNKNKQRVECADIFLLHPFHHFFLLLLDWEFILFYSAREQQQQKQAAHSLEYLINLPWSLEKFKEMESDVGGSLANWVWCDTWKFYSDECDFM
jgi:hypothetical protein